MQHVADSKYCRPTCIVPSGGHSDKCDRIDIGDIINRVVCSVTELVLLNRYSKWTGFRVYLYPSFCPNGRLNLTDFDLHIASLAIFFCLICTFQKKNVGLLSICRPCFSFVFSSIHPVHIYDSSLQKKQLAYFTCDKKLKTSLSQLSNFATRATTHDTTEAHRHLCLVLVLSCVCIPTEAS